MARLILSAGILTPLASWIALRNRGLPSASPPPIRAAIVISLMSFVNMRPRFASIAPFLCLMLCHLEWPDIDYSLVSAQFGFSLTQLRREKNEPQKVATSFLLGVVSASGRAQEPSDRHCPLRPSSSGHPRHHQR